MKRLSVLLALGLFGLACDQDAEQCSDTPSGPGGKADDGDADGADEGGMPAELREIELNYEWLNMSRSHTSGGGRHRIGLVVPETNLFWKSDTGLLRFNEPVSPRSTLVGGEEVVVWLKEKGTRDADGVEVEAWWYAAFTWPQDCEDAGDEQPCLIHSSRDYNLLKLGDLPGVQFRRIERSVRSGVHELLPGWRLSEATTEGSDGTLPVHTELIKYAPDEGSSALLTLGDHAWSALVTGAPREYQGHEGREALFATIDADRRAWVAAFDMPRLQAGVRFDVDAKWTFRDLEYTPAGELPDLDTGVEAEACIPCASEAFPEVSFCSCEGTGECVLESRYVDSADCACGDGADCE